MIALIGGIEVKGSLRKDVTLKPLTGAAELTLAELGQADLSQPEKVTRFLSETVAAVGGVPVDPGALSVGDRQYLVRQIGVRMGVDLMWLGADCHACGAPFELPVRQSALPVKEAGQGYPGRTVTVDGVDIAVRTPNGHDQSAIAGLAPDDAALALLRCLVSVPEGVDLDEEAQGRLETAIEDLSPEVVLEVAANCPDCDADLRIEVDPYLTLSQAGQGIFDDIHVLARHYHWAESEILALPRERRQAYLARIDRDRGMSASPDRVEVP